MKKIGMLLIIIGWILTLFGGVMIGYGIGEEKAQAEQDQYIKDAEIRFETIEKQIHYRDSLESIIIREAQEAQAIALDCQRGWNRQIWRNAELLSFIKQQGYGTK